MKERPILFNGPMVRALLAGTKTQTRRAVKPEGAHHLFQFRGTTAAAGADEPTGEWGWCGSERVVNKHIHCPYGKPGDRLWVRETFQRFTDDGEVLYKADRAGFEAMNELKFDECIEAFWRPSIHMPRAASRITLEITGVRVERLQDISEADALAEGVAQVVRDRLPVQQCGEYDAIDVDPVELYQDLWESINGPGSWDANPWVWVLEFRRIGEEPTP
jgi:hypothetical protein